MSSSHPRIWTRSIATGLLLASGVWAAGPGDSGRAGQMPAVPISPRSHITSPNTNAVAPGSPVPAPDISPSQAGPDVVMLGQLENYYGPVPFDHKTHVRMAEMSGGCTLCHHYTPQGQHYASCRSCHDAPSAVEYGARPGLKGAYHRQCLSCHQEWSHDTGCNSCHVAKVNSASAKQCPIPQRATSPETRMPAHVAPPPATIAYETPRAAAPVVTFHHVDHTQTFGLQCVDCHRNDSCARCHDVKRSPTVVATRHVPGELMSSCTSCHSESRCQMCHDGVQRQRFDHAERTGWSLAPHHANLECCRCHGELKQFTSPTRSCHACHAQNRRAAPVGVEAQVVRSVDPGELDCLSCHDGIRKCLAQSTTVHGPATKLNGCTSCHDLAAERSPRPGPDHQDQLCLRCHSQTAHTANGSAVASTLTLIGHAANKHRPVLEGRCTACHSPHGSAYPHLLVREFADGMYASFAVERYSLCFGCHDSKKIMSETTTTATGFRDGGRNLHAVHVNRAKGRTCGVCHDPHASDNLMLIRDQVPFGESKWQLPINFEKSKVGGSCGPGCHGEKSYDRTREQRAAAAPDQFDLLARR